jgi:hypothetical protein
MFFRIYNKVASNNITINNNLNTQQNAGQSVMQHFTQNVRPNTNNTNYTNNTRNNINNYNFLVNKNQYLYNRELYNAYMFYATAFNTNNIYTSKNYINTLLSEDRNIE